jgi:hypothetical protein
MFLEAVYVTLGGGKTTPPAKTAPPAKRAPGRSK